MRRAAPGVAGAADAEEGPGEGVVDRPLKTATLAAVGVLLEGARLVVIELSPAAVEATQSPLDRIQPLPGEARP